MKSNLKNEQTLADLQKAFEKRDKIFEADALTFAGQRVGEEEVVRDVLTRVRDQLKLSEREFRLPGLEANTDMIVGAVAKFKDDVYEGNLKPAETAGYDDIVVEFAREKVFDAMQATTVDSFELTGQAAAQSGSIVPQNEGGDSTLADEEWLFFTGDFIDLNSDAIVTAIQYVDVDGETNLNPESVYLSERDTDIQVNTVSAELVKSKVDIDSYNAFAGATELVPVAVHIAKGENVPGLT